MASPTGKSARTRAPPNGIYPAGTSTFASAHSMSGMPNCRWLGCVVALAAGAFGAGSIRPLKAADPVKDPYNLSQYDRVIEAADRDHWAYQPIGQPPVPKVLHPDWCANPIDCFILARLEATGWTPSPAAEPRALLRRVFFDVLG